MRTRFILALPAALAIATPLHAQNLVLNGDFDESLEGWGVTGDPNMTAQWLPDDSHGDPQSGSLRVTNLSLGESNGVTVRQCIPVNSGQQYTATGRLRIPSGDGQLITNHARISLRWYDGADCTIANGGPVNSASPGSFDTWVEQTVTATARSGAHSAELRALATKYPAGGSFAADFDAITLTTPSIFRNGFD